MQNMETIRLTDHITIIPASENPLSADVVIIEGEQYFWVFDVGCNQEAAEYLETLSKPKKVILSHFHEDHIGNWDKITWQELYQGKHTYQYTKKGTVIDKETIFNDGVELHVFPLPSAHAKGSLGIAVGKDYAFLGDAVYPAVKHGETVYNVQFLKEQIEFLKKLDVRCFALSHKKKYNRRKSVILAYLEAIYEMREKDNPYIKKQDDETFERVPKQYWND